MNYNQLINKALDITKKYRYLWWLSLLAIIGGVAQDGGGNSANFNFNTSSYQLDQFPPELTKFFDNFIDKIYLYLPIIITVILILAVIKIALYVIGLIAKSGLIASIVLIDNKKSSSFSHSLSLGKNHAWRYFLVRLIGGLAGLAITIVSIPIFILLFLFFFLTIPTFIVIMIIVGLVFHIAQILIVINNQPIFTTISSAWKIITQNWKKVAMLWLINLGLGLAVGIVSIGIMLILGLIGGLIAFLLYLLKLQIATIALICSPIILIIIITMLLIGSISTTFFTTYWTLGIKELLKK
ncbi:MAG: hypothetical protein WC570_01725 [Patescibacteria group bacterium]